MGALARRANAARHTVLNVVGAAHLVAAVAGAAAIGFGPALLLGLTGAACLAVAADAAR